MASDECDSLRKGLSLLQHQLQVEEDAFVNASGPSRWLVQQRIRSIQQQIDGMRKAIIQCEAREAGEPAHPNVTIAGIEETQTIQYWNFPSGQGSGFAAPNSIPLIANKATMLRIYPDVAANTTIFPTPANVDGTLQISGPAGQITLTSLNGPIPGKRATSIVRTAFNDTLNFLIPWTYAVGGLDCALKVFDPAHTADYDDDFFRLDFVDVPPLTVHGVMIHFTGPDFFGKKVDAQPDGFDLLISLDFVLRTYPISGFEYDGCEVLDWSTTISTNDGFNALFNQLASMRALSGTNDIYIGLLPPAAGCGGICGLGGGGVALYFAGNGPEASHEIGHAVGLAHVQCAAATSSGDDPKYPTYDGFPQGSIGEVGVDTETRALFDPRTTFDFMSYCGPVWTSPYHYLQIKDGVVSNNGYGAFQSNQQPSGWFAESAEVYHFAFRIHRADPPKVELRTAFHLRRPPPPRLASDDDVTLELLDSRGAVLDIVACTAVDTHLPGLPPVVDYSATFPAHSALAEIRIVQAGRPLSQHRLAAQAPKVKITEIKRVTSQHGNLARVSWQGSAPKGDSLALSYGVRFSHDGARWRALASGLTETHCVVDLDLLPGGEACRFQVVASAGLRSTTTESEPFSVPKKPRKAYLALPRSNTQVEVGDSVRLLGAAFSPDYGLARPYEMSWSSRACGPLGMGNQLCVSSLSVGLHRITMHAPDGEGGEVSSSVEIRVRPRKPCSCHRSEAAIQSRGVGSRCPHCGQGK